MGDARLRLKKELGFFDLTLLLIVAVVNLNLVPVIAAAGIGVTSLWILALFFFFLPQVVAVIVLSKQYPQEGGIYLWSKIPFGELHGFMSGWCYWTNNLFYIPTLLFYFVNFALFIGGKRALPLADNALFVSAAAILLLWVIVVLNVRGLGLGKWVQNLGAIGTFVIVTILVIIALTNLTSSGGVNAVTISSLFPKTAEWRTIAMFGVVCFAFVGLELGSVMGDEIREAESNIPKAVLTAGACCALLYVTCTLALQVSVPVKDIGVISGLIQVISHALDTGHPTWALPVVAFVLSISIAGATNAWLTGSARIPFVIGIDRFLPSSFGRLHRRYQTPYIALIFEGVVSTIIILLNSLGSTVQEIYLTLLNTAVIIQLIPFLYMFAALVKTRRARGRSASNASLFENVWLCYGAGCVGFATTAMGIVLAFIPPPNVEQVLVYELKLTLGCVAFLLPALFLYSRMSAQHGAD
jgi:amino acid transporter